MHRRQGRSTSVTDPTPGLDTNTPIKRVIYLMLENRSFNNLFGKFPGVFDGRTVGVENGKEKPLIALPELAPRRHPARPRRRTQLHERRCDGRLRHRHVTASTYAYSVFDEHQIPNYWIVGPGVRAVRPLLRER